jgi:hypothetical protein
MESNYRNWIERGEAWQMLALFQYGMEHICATEHVGLCFYEIRILKHFHFHLYKGDLHKTRGSRATWCPQ